MVSFRGSCGISLTSALRESTDVEHRDVSEAAMNSEALTHRSRWQLWVCLSQYFFYIYILRIHLR